MHEFDVTIKLLLLRAAKLTVRELTGTDIGKWLGVELPKVQNRRLDLLGEAIDGSLVHLELQSGNDPSMPLRMAEYCLGVYRLYGKFPRQILLYVGKAPLRMDSELRSPDLRYRYRAVDVRDLDGDRLLESEDIGDNIIAILARLRDDKTAVRKIVRSIAGLPASERDTALSQLLILAALRRLEETVAEEARKMPIFIDILENKVLGPPYKRGLEEGKLEGKQEGKLEGELTILRRLIEKRFGPIPRWAEERLASRSAAELEDLSVRVLDAQSMEDLLE